MPATQFGFNDTGLRLYPDAPETTDQQHCQNTRWLLEAELQVVRMAQKGRPSKMQCDSIGHFVLKHGVDFKPMAGPLPGWIKLGEPRHCFYNCLSEYARQSGRVIYCEGYAIRAGFPLAYHHAWLVEPNSRTVIDPTISDLTGYVGCAFTREGIRAHASRIRNTDSQACCLLDDWPNRWPLLRATVHELAAWLDPRYKPPIDAATCAGTEDVQTSRRKV